MNCTRIALNKVIKLHKTEKFINISENSVGSGNEYENQGEKRFSQSKKSDLKLIKVYSPRLKEKNFGQDSPDDSTITVLKDNEPPSAL